MSFRVGQVASNRNFNNSSAGGIKQDINDSIRNNYSLNYVETNQRPQNYLRSANIIDRFNEYPKLASLLAQKHSLHSNKTHSIPPTFLLTKSTPTTLIDLNPSRFDVILLTPNAIIPFEEIKALNLSSVASNPGFIWLWVGTGVRGNGIGLERGRELFQHWGYRRCEDIVWLKTNKDNNTQSDPSTSKETLFTPSIEHCLMGIRGTVRRSNDPWFVHCNVDTDVIVWEGDQFDPNLKPPELQSLIENFCLGTRRLHLYGSPSSLRRGWLTLGSSFDSLDPTQATPIVKKVEGEETNWEAVAYEKENYLNRWKQIGRDNGLENSMASMGLEGKVESLLPFVPELDALRPKSPPGFNGQASSGGLGRGRGAGLGVTRTNYQNGNYSSSPQMMNSRGGGRGAMSSTPYNSYQTYSPVPPPPPPPQWNPYAQNQNPYVNQNPYAPSPYQQIQQNYSQPFYAPSYQQTVPPPFTNYNSFPPFYPPPPPPFYPPVSAPRSEAQAPMSAEELEAFRYQEWLMNGNRER